MPEVDQQVRDGITMIQALSIASKYRGGKMKARFVELMERIENAHRIDVIVNERTVPKKLSFV